ncbi:MAG TPA: polysaccharide biosynthesis/export family protein [Terriglobales bacterium]|jgi:polysaccharide export outer membrane protein
MMNSRHIWLHRLLLAAAIALTCAPVWAQGDAPAKSESSAPAPAAPGTAGADDESYVIGADDVLGISVWKEPDVSKVVPVRSDGKISLPLVGEIQAAGRTPKQLKVELTDKLKNYISEPEVTVIVQETRSKKYNVLGQVVRPGSYMLTNAATVLDAIAQAGGFRDFAKKKSMYVLRKNADGSDIRLPFNYKDVIAGKHTEQNVKLQPGDTVVVP